MTNGRNYNKIKIYLPHLNTYSLYLQFYLQQTGLNALHLSSKEGHLDIVRSLLAAGIPVNSTTKVRSNAPLFCHSTTFTTFYENVSSVICLRVRLNRTTVAFVLHICCVVALR